MRSGALSGVRPGHCRFPLVEQALNLLSPKRFPGRILRIVDRDIAQVRRHMKAKLPGGGFAHARKVQVLHGGGPGG